MRSYQFDSLGGCKKQMQRMHRISHQICHTPMASPRHHQHTVMSTINPQDASTSASVFTAVQFLTSSTPQPRSPTPYTGSAGVAYALWRAGTLLQQPTWQQEAHDLAAASLRRAAHVVDASVLDGRAGVLLVNCLVAAASSEGTSLEQLQPLLSQYAAICNSAASPASGASDEFLYGRAGTLFGALLLRQQLGPAAVPDGAVAALTQQMLTSGRQLCARVPAFSSSRAPLAYVWPAGPDAAPYLGAAHGLMGVLYVLLLVQQHAPQCFADAAGDLADVRTALRYVLSCECDGPGGAAPGSGGHYPTLMQLPGLDDDGGGDGDDSRTLVHWCHGAPGAVYLFCTAHEVLGESDATYLPAALRAGEVVWQQGLLKKGPGLCHGVSGNAYALLRLYKASKDPQWLRRAQLFAAFMVSEAGKADWHTPDHPTSLYEGMAGGVCLLAELHAAAAAAAAAAGSTHVDAEQQHQAVSRLAAFPLFELWT